jgi:hypothetical protein
MRVFCFATLEASNLAVRCRKTVCDDLKTKQSVETPDYEHENGGQRLKNRQKTTENGISGEYPYSPEKESEKGPIDQAMTPPATTVADAHDR